MSYMKLTGAQIVVECLKKEGVKIIFGISWRGYNAGLRCFLPRTFY